VSLPLIIFCDRELVSGVGIRCQDHGGALPPGSSHREGA
jgi:hypothetical protein